MITGSIYYDNYEYSTGTVIVGRPYDVQYFQKDIQNERLLVCANCGTEYLLNLNTKEYLIALKCTQCGGKLRFKK